MTSWKAYLAIDLGSDRIASYVSIKGIMIDYRDINRVLDLVELIPGVEPDESDIIGKKTIPTNRIVLDLKILTEKAEKQYNCKFAYQNSAFKFFIPQNESYQDLLKDIASSKEKVLLPNPKYLIFSDPFALKGSPLFTNNVQSAFVTYFEKIGKKSVNAQSENIPIEIVSLLLSQITNLIFDEYIIKKIDADILKRELKIVYAFPNVYTPSIINSVLSRIRMKTPYKNIDFIYESDAVALGINEHVEEQEVIMVTDVGKGTTDIGVLQSGEGNTSFSVLARTGLARGGGYVSFIIILALNRIWNDTVAEIDILLNEEMEKINETRSTDDEDRKKIFNVFKTILQASNVRKFKEMLSDLLLTIMWKEFRKKYENDANNFCGGIVLLDIFRISFVLNMYSFVEEIKKRITVKTLFGAERVVLDKKSVAELKSILEDKIRGIEESVRESPNSICSRIGAIILTSFEEKVKNFLDEYSRGFSRNLVSRLLIGILKYLGNKIVLEKYKYFLMKNKLNGIIDEKIRQSTQDLIKISLNQAIHTNRIQGIEEKVTPKKSFLMGRGILFGPLRESVFSYFSGFIQGQIYLGKKPLEVVSSTSMEGLMPAELKLLCVIGAHKYVIGNLKINRKNIPWGCIIIENPAIDEVYIYCIRDIKESIVIYKLYSDRQSDGVDENFFDEEIKLKEIKKSIHNLYFVTFPISFSEYKEYIKNRNIYNEDPLKPYRIFIGQYNGEEGNLIREIRYNLNTERFEILVLDHNGISNTYEIVQTKNESVINSAEYLEVIASIWPAMFSPTDVKMEKLIKMLSSKFNDASLLNFGREFEE